VTLSGSTITFRTRSILALDPVIPLPASASSTPVFYLSLLKICSLLTENF
jgi:hypothetical protein